MRFIHTADLHIDQPFSGVNSEQTYIQDLLKSSNQQVLANIVDRCIEKKVDFLLIVGDTFHQVQSSIHTQKLMMEQFKRLEDEDIKVVLSFGNHDYYQAHRYWFEWPDNVILFKKEEVQTKTIQLRNGESVAISGFSYENRWIEKSMVSEFPSRNQETTYHIGFYHGDQTSNYAPFTWSELPSSYDYWALGHIHKAEVLTDNPLTAYSGTPQGHTKKEDQAKGVLLVDINSGGSDYGWLDVANIKWHKSEIEIDEALEKKELLLVLEEKINDSKYTHPLNIVDVNVTTTAENARDLLNEKEEILLFLQETILKKSNHKILLKDIALRQSTSDKLIMGFETTLIDDLGRKYKNKDNFKKTVNDLLQQPAIAKYLSWEEEDITERVDESSQLIKDKMIFKNEVGQ
ncbi:metallophosphoesterase family protein [Vagococcus carniphilus]|uniref:Calcineurin-like phosphoesterase domain-containing protein n=1 Tax=Vagococcus carniphilus TaxID=218144 RepID=A0A430ATK9_9ENTE|nr:DNA repair exonuclease [Vagococcus carniphilus]QNN73339.1 DNA repair exonuclease [Vagococcus carniphilus]RSU11388.1 hypothetical protein CBF28_12470 [Vagococcus carniphilus]